jgi:uncharacterized protein
VVPRASTTLFRMVTEALEVTDVLEVITYRKCLFTFYQQYKSKSKKNYICKMNRDQQFEKLREQLNKEKEWPMVYMFKFIIPAENRKIALVESKFSDEATITQKESTTGKYMSITIKEVMLDADSIINKYKEMEGIEGLMAL